MTEVYCNGLFCARLATVSFIETSQEGHQHPHDYYIIDVFCNEHAFIDRNSEFWHQQNIALFVNQE